MGRSAASQQLTRGGGAGGEAAVVADALNDVMGKMLTVVTKKTKVSKRMATIQNEEDRALMQTHIHPHTGICRVNL